MGTQIQQELEVIVNAAGTDTDVLGFYAHGEFGPGSDGTQSMFHNCTMVTVLLAEND